MRIGRGHECCDGHLLTFFVVVRINADNHQAFRLEQTRDDGDESEQRLVRFTGIGTDQISPPSLAEI